MGRSARQRSVAAEVHDCDLLAQLADDREIVGDQQIRELSLSPQPPDQPADAGLGGRVERAGRLVED
jgi:hypothetical protein